MIRHIRPLLLLPLTVVLLTRCETCQHHIHSETPAFDSRTYHTSITNPHQTRQTHTSDDPPLPPGIIAAIAIACAVVVVALVLLFLCLFKRLGKPADKDYQTFEDWRQERNLTSIEISRPAAEQSPQNPADGPSPETSIK